MKPLSFGAACFYSILRNSMTVVGIVSKPLGLGILLINVLHTLQQVPLSSPGEGHVHSVALTQNSSRSCLLPQGIPPSSGQPHTPLPLFSNTLMGIQGRQLLVIPVQQDSLPGPSSQQAHAQTPFPLGKYPALSWPPGSSPAHSMNSIHSQLF